MPKTKLKPTSTVTKKEPVPPPAPPVEKKPKRGEGALPPKVRL